MRHLEDLCYGHLRGLRFSEQHAEYAFRFFERYLRHSKGKFARKQFVLSPWQKFRIGCCFGWLRADGTRRFRTSYNDVARKNGKSSEAAGVGLYGLVADGEAGAEVYSAATKKDQARIVFDEAKRMVRSSPALRDVVKRMKLNLSVADTESKFEPLSADVRGLDGLNPSLVVVDELHKHANRDLLDVMNTALGARDQPLIWIITTAGDPDPSTAYAAVREYAEAVVVGALDDDSWFVYIASIDDKDDPFDPECWVKANPNLDVSVSRSYLEGEARTARGMPTAQRAFRRLNCNQRVADAGKAIPFERWVLCTEGPLDLSALRGRKAYVGLDLSSKLDLTAAALLFPPLGKDEKWILHVMFWCPGENIRDREQRDRAQYERWVAEGWIEATPGNIIDHTAAEKQILEWKREFQIAEVLHDPWTAAQIATRLQAEGLQCREFVQGLRSYTAPTNEFLAIVQDINLEHGGNPVLNWMANNLAVEKDKNNNIMPTKKKSTGRIDGISASIMALGGAMAAMGQDDLSAAIMTRGGFA